MTSEEYIREAMQELALAREEGEPLGEGERALRKRIESGEPPPLMSEIELAQVPTYGPKNIVD